MVCVRGGGQTASESGSPLVETGARQSVGVNESKKTFSQFVVEAHNLNEALPLAIPAALKLGSMALSAYSAYKAGQNLKKGKSHVLVEAIKKRL